MNTGAPFFIVGCPRSGTTLMSVLLDRNSRLCVPPETAFYDEIVPSLTRDDDALLLDTLRSWRRLSELRTDPQSVLRRLGGAAPCSHTVLRAILDLYAENQRKEHCGEKTPQHLRHVPTILREFPDARIVCMLRDGRDVALSLDAMPWWTPQWLPVWATLPGSKRQRLLRAASTWQQYLKLTLGFAARYSHQFRIVRYEDLIARPAEVVASTTEFVGATFEARQIDAAIGSDVVLPRSMQWKGRALHAVEAHVGTRRRATATPAQLALLDHTLRNELEAAGYSV